MQAEELSLALALMLRGMDRDEAVRGLITAAAALMGEGDEEVVRQFHELSALIEQQRTTVH